MKQVLRWFGAAALLVAGAALAHGDANAPEKKAEGKRTAFGRTGDPRQVTRTVDVDMSDAMRFTPARLTVKRGDTVRFRVKNSGSQLHEMVLGTEKDLREHAALMRKFPGMEHDEPYMVHVAAGKSGEMVWQFSREGRFMYACLVPGHFEAGMLGRINVR